MRSVVAISDVAEVTSGQGAPQDPSAFGEEGRPFVRAGSLQALVAGGGENQCERISDLKAAEFRLRLFPADTVVFAKSGMSATLGRVYRLKAPAYLVSHLAAIVCGPALDPGYLQWWLERNPPSRLIPNEAYPSIRTSAIGAQMISLPELSEQRRIARILDKDHAIRIKRRKSIRLADELIRSVFLDMFGDPIKNRKEWTTRTLGELVTIRSGGTPSKAKPTFWSGDYPWVSPKDMKRLYLGTSEDTISDSVFEETALRPVPTDTVLIVVRGMILAHTIPVAVTTRPVAINQDIKAMICGDRILPEFLLWLLLCSHGYLRSLVDDAAHGTKRLETVRLLATRLPVPEIKLQQRFVDVLRRINGIRAKLLEALAESNALGGALQHSLIAERMS